MRLRPRPISPYGLSPSFLLLVALLGATWLAGGASRGDVAGQVIVRTVAWSAVVLASLFGDRPSFSRVRGVVVILLAALLLALLQCVPLPPEAWQALPGRTMLAEAATASGQAQPWRPLAIVPSAAGNAAASLVMPLTTLLLVCGLRDAEWRWLPGLVLAMIAASMLLGLLQFSGGGFDNPFVNDSPAQVGGTFANRNHFALLMALGCVLAPTWAFLDGRRPGWRGPAVIGLLLLFALAILASGSRAGLILGGAGLALGLALVRRPIRRELSRYPRWVAFALVAGIIGMITIPVLLSIAAGRAVSIDRMLAINPEQDIRSRALPTILAMVGTYFPVGSGLGGFDTLFRIHEPFNLLKPTHFNHAHNDWLEIALDAGLPGILLLVGSMGWWAWASVRAWRAGGRDLAGPASAMLLLVFVASGFDYPARTPIIMVVMVIMAVWLGRSAHTG